VKGIHDFVVVTVKEETQFRVSRGSESRAEERSQWSSSPESFSSTEEEIEDGELQVRIGNKSQVVEGSNKLNGFTKRLPKKGKVEEGELVLSSPIEYDSTDDEEEAIQTQSRRRKPKKKRGYDFTVLLMFQTSYALSLCE